LGRVERVSLFGSGEEPAQPYLFVIRDIFDGIEVKKWKKFRSPILVIPNTENEALIDW
jgi:hypothetical protein